MNSAFYTIPYFLYLALSILASRFPQAYPWAYPVAALLAAVVTLALFRRGSGTLRPHSRITPGILVGLLGIFLWILLSTPEVQRFTAQGLPVWLQPSDRLAYDPFESIPNPAMRSLFLAARIGGLVLLVPLIEEFFFRGFLVRYLVSANWKQVPIGRFTLVSFLLSVLLFSLAHTEFLAAAVYCALLNGLLYKTKDLWNCIVAHTASNTVLVAYVLVTGNWYLW